MCSTKILIAGNEIIIAEALKAQIKSFGYVCLSDIALDLNLQ